MKQSAKEFLVEVSNKCYSEITVYKYSKTALQASDRYKEGRITALNYIQDLIYYYLQEENQIKDKFINAIKTQQLDTKSLKDGEYKKAILDTLEDLLSKYTKDLDG